MRHCTQCGADLPANAQFCGRCGTTREVSVEQELSQQNISGASRQPSPSNVQVSSVESNPILRSEDRQQAKGVLGASSRPVPSQGIPRRPKGTAQVKADVAFPQQAQSSLVPSAAPSSQRSDDISLPFPGSDSSGEESRRTGTPSEIRALSRDQVAENEPLPPHLARLSVESESDEQRQRRASMGRLASSPAHPAVTNPLGQSLLHPGSESESAGRQSPESVVESPRISQSHPIVHRSASSHLARLDRDTNLSSSHLAHLDQDTNPSLPRVARVEPISEPRQRSVLPDLRPKERDVSEIKPLSLSSDVERVAERPLQRPEIPVRPVNRLATPPGVQGGAVPAREEEKVAERLLPRPGIPARPVNRPASFRNERGVSEKKEVVQSVEGMQVVERSSQKPEPTSSKQEKSKRRVIPSAEGREQVVERSSQRPEREEPANGSEPTSGEQEKLEEQRLPQAQTQERSLREPGLEEVVNEWEVPSGEQRMSGGQPWPQVEQADQSAEDSVRELDTVVEVPSEPEPSPDEQEVLEEKELPPPKESAVAIEKPLEKQETSMTSINEPSPSWEDHGPFEENSPPFLRRREIPEDRPLWKQETRLNPTSGLDLPFNRPGLPDRRTPPLEIDVVSTDATMRSHDPGESSQERMQPFHGWGVPTNTPLWAQETRMTPTSGLFSLQRERMAQTPPPDINAMPPGERQWSPGQREPFDRKTPLPEEKVDPLTNEFPGSRGQRTWSQQFPEPKVVPASDPVQPEPPKVRSQNVRAWSEDTWDVSMNSRFVLPSQTDRSRAGGRIKTILALLIALVVLGGLGLFISNQENVGPSSSGPALNDGQVPGTVTASVTTTPTTINLSSTVVMAFTGVLNGPLAANTVENCGTSNGLYDFGVLGSIAGTNYRIDIEVENYHGAGTYNNQSANPTSGLGLVFVTNASSTGDRWESFGQPGTITVNKDGQSGSVTAKIFNSTHKSQASITGTWSC